MRAVSEAASVTRKKSRLDLREDWKLEGQLRGLSQPEGSEGDPRWDWKSGQPVCHLCDCGHQTCVAGVWLRQQKGLEVWTSRGSCHSERGV